MIFVMQNNIIFYMLFMIEKLDYSDLKIIRICAAFLSQVNLIS